MSFSDDMIQKVWEKADTDSYNDKNVYRKDQCGAWINRSQYGDRKSDYGWEVDHITPVSKGGTDALSNLRPLQWENNARKSDGSLSCPVTSNGSKNVKRSV